MATPPKGVELYRAQGAGANGGATAGPGYGRSGHRLMCPPPGYKFIPKREQVCREYGCFECYDIYCERCESKDRRIIELEMRNNELVKHITLLQARVFPRAGDSRATGGSAPTGDRAMSATGGSGAEPFAYVQSPVLYDPGMGIQYQATTTFSPVAGGSARMPPPS
mmetsp:Transcript_13597/g.28417  ORF Transcript_13597/g.28417 Transcript_13597/m.28417 type:complete len:166 (-) Transcript_13597:283-780(-)